jgi:GNAT superfamily N-acetyltransferase
VQADLEPIRSIADSYGNLASWPQRPDYLDHELGKGTLTVCEEDGEVIGFGAVLRRGRIAHLADLFVRRDRVGTGVGRAILAGVLPADGERVTFASPDPRALPLYVKSGMWPIAPLLYVTGDGQAAMRLPDPGATLAQADPASIRALDRTASGRDRPQDLEFLQAVHAHGFLAHRGPEVIGYGFCRIVYEASRRSSSAFLGPVGAQSQADAVRTITALLRWTAEHAAQMTIPVFGPHPATPIMLASQFRVKDIDTYMASRDGLINLKLYCPSIELG